MKFLPSTASMVINVVELEVPTTTTLTVSPDPPMEGQDTPGPGDGAVEFSVDGVSAGVVQLDAPAVDLGLQLAAGPHTVEARYLPNG